MTLEHDPLPDLQDRTLAELAAAVAVYGFRDSLGHPLEGCEEYMEMVRRATAAPAPSPIACGALVRGSEHAAPDLARDLRGVAMEAARQWGLTHCSAADGHDPEKFGRGAALTFLTALRNLNAGFEPCPEFRRGSA